MVKSTVNDWIVCEQDGGSIVTKQAGSISCENIKNVATTCVKVVPDSIKWRCNGPMLRTPSGIFYSFDGATDKGWPRHDPCGNSAAYHKNGVSNPGGQIYLR